jgi:hypothetical protein
MQWRTLDLGQDGRLDAVEEAQEDGPGSVFDNKEDGHGDDQPDQRIEYRHPNPNADRADEYRQRGKAVDPRVLPVSNERR